MVVEAVSRRRRVDAVVLAIDNLALSRQPRHVAELVETAPRSHLIRQVRVVAIHERDRPFE